MQSPRPPPPHPKQETELGVWEAAVRVGLWSRRNFSFGREGEWQAAAWCSEPGASSVEGKGGDPWTGRAWGWLTDVASRHPSAGYLRDPPTCRVPVCLASTFLGPPYPSWLLLPDSGPSLPKVLITRAPRQDKKTAGTPQANFAWGQGEAHLAASGAASAGRRWHVQPGRTEAEGCAGWPRWDAPLPRSATVTLCLWGNAESLLHQEASVSECGDEHPRRCQVPAPCSLSLWPSLLCRR